MQIHINEHLRPYSHLPGTTCLIPGSVYFARIYPCFIEIFQANQPFSEPPMSLQLLLKGPVKDFTIQQDLEKGRIVVWGHYSDGYIRYSLFANKKDEGRGIELYVEKSGEKGLEIKRVLKNLPDYESGTICKNNESLFLLTSYNLFERHLAPQTPRIFFGNHKSQDWDLVKRRLDPKEIFPVWHRLGLLTEQIPLYNSTKELPDIDIGTLSLLKSCMETIEKKDNEKLIADFMNLFQAGFNGILTPCLFDAQHQGLCDDSIKGLSSLNSNKTTPSPLLLLTESAKLLNFLFVQQNQNSIAILPLLPKELHCGRALHMPAGAGYCHIEWTKKMIRRMIFFSNSDQEIEFVFRKVKKYRLRMKNKNKLIEATSKISFEKDTVYYFDNFIS